MGPVFASTTDGTISIGDAWSEEIGWLNFATTNGNVHVTDSELTGGVWNALYGWIRLNHPPIGGVKNNAEGVLSGSAWGENLGWINFTGVTINTNGIFSGTANGDHTGIINFSCTNCLVQTDWRPASTRNTGGTAVLPGVSSPMSTLSVQGSSGVDPFTIVSSTGSPLLTVLANGRVGIGTSTPTAKLSVVGNISNILDSANTASIIQIATTSVGTGPNSIFVSDGYAYVANQSSNNISIVDVSNPSAPIQVAITSVGSGSASIYVSGRYAYVANFTSNNISVVDISGTEVSSLMAHSVEVGNLKSRNDIFAQGNVMAGTSLLVGSGGIMSQGTMSVFASSTGATSSIFDVSSIQTANIFKVFANGRVGINTSSPIASLAIQTNDGINPFTINSSTGDSMLTVLVNGNILIGTSTSPSAYKLYIDAGGSANAGLGVNGFIRASGFITGTSTLDIAETYPVDPECSANENCPQVGDVVCSVEDRFSKQTDNLSSYFIEQCSVFSADNIIGVVSEKPGFILGGYDATDIKIKGLYPTSFRPVALAGRVPVKVSLINGSIKAGDYLTSSNLPGVAVKALEPGKAIGTALQSFEGNTSATGMITMFVNTGWSLGSPTALTETDELIMPNFSTTVLNKFTLSVKNSLRKLGLLIKDGVATVKEIFTDKITTEQLCVGATCINESQLQEFLNKTQATSPIPVSQEVVVSASSTDEVTEKFIVTTTTIDVNSSTAPTDIPIID